MRVSQLLTRVRDRLDEATAGMYSDVELVRYLDEGVQDMFRLQAQHDESYHNCELDITAAADIRSINSDVTVYDLPTWVHKITSVRVLAGSAGNRGVNIPVRTLHNLDGSFWAYHGMNRIMVFGQDAGSSLTIELSKVPAPMNAGTLVAPDTLTFSTTQIHFDQSSATESLYEGVLEDNWHLNSLFEFTGVDSAAHNISGAIVRGSASGSVYDTNAPFTTVAFDKAAPATPAAGDTWEMHAEIPSSNAGYLIALAAHKAFIRKSNYEAIAVLAPDLDREYRRFVEAVTPRQDQILNFAGMENDVLLRRDMNRDETW